METLFIVTKCHLVEDVERFSIQKPSHLPQGCAEQSASYYINHSGEFWELITAR